MFKIYQKYLINNFLVKFLYITIIFFSLIIILSLLEEISFFKDLEINFLYPYFLTLLNAPITLFEIFPFIFLLTTQFLFYDLFKSDELNLLKKNGLNNLKIIKILFYLSLFIGLFNIMRNNKEVKTLREKYKEMYDNSKDHFYRNQIEPMSHLHIASQNIKTCSEIYTLYINIINKKIKKCYTLGF